MAVLLFAICLQAEEHNCLIQARVELLKNKTQEVSGTTDVVEKVCIFHCEQFLFAKGMYLLLKYGLEAMCLIANLTWENLNLDLPNATFAVKRWHFK